jgi:rhodanese-related sulfurtransferase
LETASRLLLADGLWLAAAAAVSLSFGIVADQLFRHPPLGLLYHPAALRIIDPSAPAASAIFDVTDLRPVLAQPGVVLLDARPHLFFEMGHLPGALPLAREEFPADFALLETQLRAPGKTFVVYCSDAGCEDGARVAQSLRERGIERVSVFIGGFDAWEAAGQPVEVAK